MPKGYSGDFHSFIKKLISKLLLIEENLIFFNMIDKKLFSTIFNLLCLEMSEFDQQFPHY